MVEAHRTARVVVTLRERDLDHQNHVYHGVMLTLLDEGRVRFFDEHLGLADPASYVVVRVELDYLGETVLTDSPLSIEFSVECAGNTSLRTRETVITVAGRPVAAGIITCVLWDRESRTPRALAGDERARLGEYTALTALNGIGGVVEVPDVVDMLENER